MFTEGSLWSIRKKYFFACPAKGREAARQLCPEKKLSTHPHHPHQEPGKWVLLFDNEYRHKSRWINVCVALDKLLSANFAFRELLNFLLEPLAQLDDWLPPLDHTSGALVVYEKL